jgi:hypothetical protein
MKGKLIIMLVKGNFIYLGLDTIQGKKDTTKTFYNLSLLQDTDVVKVFLDSETVKKIVNIKPNKMDKLNCELKISIGQKTYVSLETVEKIA